MTHKRQLLVAEDNELNREILREILSEEYDILEAENGKVALELLKEHKEQISLILLDVMMPVMDGYTFLDITANDPELSVVPVIVLTQRDQSEDEITALSHGANDFVTKPYRPLVLKHRIANLISFREQAAMINQFKYDHLTGLYTKDFFYRMVRQRLDENPEKEYTIICCNLENFKLYNDTYGRAAGDRMLVEEAKILRQRIVGDGICARYSADRFLCLVEKENESIGREQFIRTRENNHHTRILENMTVKLGIYDIVDRSVPVEQMCDRALWVVDTIKGIYGQDVAVYDDTLRGQLLREQAITDAMESALEENQFVVYFQPKCSLRDDSMIGAEALVRWIHPEWGFISPGEFVPLFEKNGFVSRLDAFVWEQTCRKIREWLDRGLPIVPVSVNVSRVDVFNVELVETLSSLIKKYNIESRYLHLEVTESAYTDNPKQIIQTVDKLRQEGFIIEMDDFGSGYSSLGMIGQMAIDVLKLDMGFIRDELSIATEKCILEDVIHVAHRMHLKVVAEGVETSEQKQRLYDMGCDYAQGYYYSKPVEDTEFEKMLGR